MNGDFHFYGTGTAAVQAGLSVQEAKIVANAAEFIDYFIGDYYWSNWKIVADDSWWPTVKFTITHPQLSAQSSLAAGVNYYSDYWLAYHFPPGNRKPDRKPYTGEMSILQDRFISNFQLREVNSNVSNKARLCRPYSQFAIDMVADTISKYQAIKSAPNWKDVVRSSISKDRYISDAIPRDTFALIFLGARMHVLADTWAHQDFTGYDDKTINYVDGDVYADVNTPGKMDKAPFSALDGFISGFFTGVISTTNVIGGLIEGVSNMDTDIVFAPKSGSGHGNMGHYPDYGWLNFEYPASWRPDTNARILRENPKQFDAAWKEIAAVISICLGQKGDVPMPQEVHEALTKRFALSSTKLSAPLQCEEFWAGNAARAFQGTKRWKDLVKSPELGVTHGLAVTRFGNVWIKDGSILHMYELAAAMHFSWCEQWTKENPGYDWLSSLAKQEEQESFNPVSPKNFIPKGSYVITCRDISVTLHCEARKINQSWVAATYDLTLATDPDLANMDGVLTYQGHAAPVNFMPAGSYKQTCRNIRVVLTCKAQKEDQSWVDAEYDLTSAGAGVDLANMNGVLKNMA